MSRWFNIAGLCQEDIHYMLPPTTRLPDLEELGSPVIMVITQGYNLPVSRFSAFLILEFVSSATFYTT
jgi:hypothetical protein